MMNHDLGLEEYEQQMESSTEGSPFKILPENSSSTGLNHISIPPAGQDWPVGIHFVKVPTLKEVRWLLGPESTEIRTVRSLNYFDSLSNKGRAKLRLGMHDRGEEYVFAAGKIHKSDAGGHSRHLPVHLKVIRYKEYRIQANEIFDVSSLYTHWPNLDPREELYVFVHVDKLFVESGACLVVHGNILTLCLDEIILESNMNNAPQTGNQDFKIKILGTQHSPFGTVRAMPARDGQNGINGTDGKDNHNFSVSSTPFGTYVDSIGDDLNGEKGQHGKDGEPGTHGQNGGMSMVADIRIGSLANFSPKSLEIFGQAGSGYPGGNGGDGGSGGNGGNGMDSKVALNGTYTGGYGGCGGNGGDGGRGGNGGNGGLASSIYVVIPESFKECINPVSLDSQGGDAGLGGKGAVGGSSGLDGELCQMISSISRKGKNGDKGKSGISGHSRKGPKIHLNIL